MGKRLDAARKELSLAAGAVQRMRDAGSLDVAEEAWKDFLGRTTRVWNKTEAALKGDPKFFNSPHVKRVRDALKHDALIVYLSRARDADEHTIGDVTERAPGGISVNPLRPGRPLHIERLSFGPNHFSIDAPSGFALEVKPPRVVPLPATTRGVTYAVPTVHNEAKIEPLSLVHFAELGLKFYRAFLDDLSNDGWDSNG